MFMTVLEGIDLVRASLLSQVVFQKRLLQPFDRITNMVMRERITEVIGERYEQLRQWIDNYREAGTEREVLDIFLRRLFSDLLSRSGFGFQRDFDAVRVISNLIDSARSFRQSVERIDGRIDSASEYIRMVDEGILADQYDSTQQLKESPAILIAPAYTFLLSNRAVDFQFWVNLDSPSWNRRLYQPLTQPYVLSAQWKSGERWTDVHERDASREMLRRLITGLLKRCRRRVYLGFSRYDERGYEQIGELRVIFDYILRGMSLKAEQADVVMETEGDDA